MLYIIHQDIPFDAIGFNVMFAEDIPHLAECGILYYDNHIPRVAIPVISKQQYDELRPVILKHMCLLADILEEPLRSAFPKLKIEIPRHLEGRVAEFRTYTCYALPMTIIKKAIDKGDFLKNVDHPTPPMILVIKQ